MTARYRLITIATVAPSRSKQRRATSVRPSNPAEVNPAVDRALFAVYKQSPEDAPTRSTAEPADRVSPRVYRVPSPSGGPRDARPCGPRDAPPCAGGDLTMASAACVGAWNGRSTASWAASGHNEQSVSLRTPMTHACPSVTQQRRRRRLSRRTLIQSYIVIVQRSADTLLIHASFDWLVASYLSRSN